MNLLSPVSKKLLYWKELHCSKQDQYIFFYHNPHYTDIKHKGTGYYRNHCILFLVNKAKVRISKQVFQENKARQIFRKTIISYPLIRTYARAYQGVRDVHFSENLACFVFLKRPFWDSPDSRITNVLRVSSTWVKEN